MTSGMLRTPRPINAALCVNKNMRNVAVILLMFLSVGCTRTENGIVFGTPDYEKRDISVSDVDLSILRKADELLSNEAQWDKSSVRKCSESHRLSLYCALEKASVEIMGKYVHRQAGLQEVRFVIDDKYKSRWKVHRLADFNTHPDTTFSDVKLVLKEAIISVEGKLTHNIYMTPLVNSTKLSGNQK